MKKLMYVMMCLIVAGGAMASIIQPTAVVSDEYVLIGASETINNAGMNTPVNGGDSLASATAATHAFGGTYNQSYVSSDPGGYPSDFFDSLPGGDTDVDIVYDLSGGGDLTIGSVLLWQYENNGGGAANVGNGARTIEIRVNTEAEGSEVFAGAATIVTLLPVTDGDEDSLNDLAGVNSAQVFALDAIASGRYVQLSITDNYLGQQGITAGGDRVGLGEVRFASEVPEPMTLALLGLGSLALIRRKK